MMETVATVIAGLIGIAAFGMILYYIAEWIYTSLRK